MSTKKRAKQWSKETATKVRRLAEITGLSVAGVRKCIREKRRPGNPLVRAAWDRALGLTEPVAAAKGGAK